MQNVTLKEFAIDMATITVFSILFAAVFIYLIPAIGVRVSYDEDKIQSQVRANAYHQYLVRKGHINE